MKRNKVLIRLITLAVATIMCLVIVQTVSATDPDTVAVWHFDEGTGIAAADATGNGHDGSLINSPAWVDGYFGKALQFDGTNYVSIPDDPDLDISMGTWEAWIKFDEKPSTAGHLMNPVAKQEQYWIHASSDDTIQAKISVGSTRYIASTSPGFIQTDEWYYVACTYDQETLRLFINGEFISENTAPSGAIDSSNPILAVGTWSTPTDYFLGVIDEVRIWDRPLTVDEIKIHQCLVGDWDFDENTGSIAYDSSGFENHGDIYGSTWVSGWIGSALQFDGDGYVKVMDSDSLDVTKVTLEAWIKPSVAPQPYGRIVFKGDSYPDVTYFLAYDPSGHYMRMSAYKAPGSYVTATSTTPVTDTTKWYHIIGVYDGEESRIYIDGVLENTAITATADIDITDHDIGIGRDPHQNSFGFQGIIDEVKIWACVKQQPNADTGGPYTAYIGESVTFDGTGSTDPDGTVEAWLWDLDNNWIFSEFTAIVGPLSASWWGGPGVFPIHLMVVDNDGLIGGTSTTVTIYDNQPPVADADGPYSVYLGDPVQLDGSGSYDPDGTIVLYEWDFEADGTYDYSSLTTHSPLTYYYNGPGVGTYTARLRVTDEHGLSDTATSTVSVLAYGDIEGTVSETDSDPVPGVTVNLYDIGGLIASATTDGGGYYGFFNLEAGDYTVEVIAPGYSPYKDSALVTVVNGGTTTQDFHLFKHLTVSGYKYEDLDGSSPTSNPLDDWQIYLNRFCDDFNDGDANGWNEGPGSWSVNGGSLVYEKIDENNGDHTYSIINGVTVADFIMEIDIKQLTDQYRDSGIQFWHQDSNNYYYANFDDDKLGLWQFKNGNYIADGFYHQKTHSYDLAQWHTLRVEVKGDSFKLYVDDTLEWTETLTDWYAGGIGVHAHRDSNTQFDNVCIGQSTKTQEGGYYDFTISYPGSYDLYEEIQTGWTQTYPTDKYTLTITDADSGEPQTGNNFWNFEWLKVSGTKYEQVLCDGFEDGDASDWEEVNGDWTVVDESGNMVLEQSLPYYVPGVRVAGQTSWTNYVVQAKVKVTGTSGRWGGILLRVDDPGTPTTAGTYYELYLQEAGYLQLTKTVSGTRTWPGGSWNSPQFRQYIGPFYNEWWNIKAEVVDGNIRGKAWPVGDPEPENWLIDWEDTTDPILSGKVGLITFSTENGVPVYFDDICVYKPLQGWTVELWDDSSVVGSTATDAYGYYEFVVKTPGSYDIMEYLESDWSELYPEFHIGDGSLVLGYSFNAESGVDITDYDFVNFEHAIVIVTKEDTEGDPVDGWEITINGQTDYTEADGTVSFTLTQPGMYTVTEESRTDWTAIGDTSYDFTAHSGGEYDFTFVNFKWMKIHGHKYFDGNGDGIWNYYEPYHEPYLDGWTINLADNGNIDSALTGDMCNSWDTGYYEFIITEPGTYMVSEDVNTDIWTKTEPACGDHQVVVQSGVNVELNFGNWLGPSEITTSNLCWFDMDEAEERQFKIIFTPDVNDDPNLYKVSATNPGQFYYNVFYSGVAGTSDTFSITIPEDFETQGANPVHIYSSLNAGPEGCLILIPDNDISHLFNIDTSSNPITVTPISEYDGFIYIMVHCDYALKQDGGYELQYYDDNGVTRGHAIKDPNPKSIIDMTDYTFKVTGAVDDEEEIQNRNVFKKFRGIIGFLTDIGSAAIPGIDVTITGPSIEDGGITLTTDEDGFYGYSFFHKGKPATYDVVFVNYGIESIKLKAGHFAEVSYQEE